jgi:hypothetical protein
MAKHKAAVTVDLGYMEVSALDANVRADGLLPAVERKLKNMDDEELADRVRLAFDMDIREARVTSSRRVDDG